jgi:hypothetical protein
VSPTKVHLFAIPVAILVAAGTLASATRASAQTNGSFALAFDGVHDLVTVPGNPLLELTAGTVELWFQPNWTPGTLNYDPVLLGDQLGPALTRYSLHVDRNLSGIILANGNGSSSVPCSFTPGEWVHLALVASGPGAQVYVNGQLIGSTTNTFGSLIGLPFNLGSDGVGAFFPGELDEVRLWNIPRSPTDIRFNMSRALGGNEAGLVAYWRLNEGVGTTATDATANQLDGTLEGASWTNNGIAQVNTSGSFGLALDLSASRGSYVQVASVPSLPLGNQFTFEAWIKPRAARCNTILSRGDGVNLTNTDFILEVGFDGTNCGVMKLALMTAGNWTTSASAVPLNAWTHVAVTFDGMTNRFYINGVLDNAMPASAVMVQSGSALFIGRQGTAGTNYFEGELDEVRIWNTVRSEAEIQANVSHRLPPNQPGLLGYWSFDEQAGVRAYDSSGQGNHGTLINRPVRVPSFWTPLLTLNGASPLTVECHSTFSDPGAGTKCVPVGLAAGDIQAFALKPDGIPIGWGFNPSGQLNVPSAATSVIALAMGLSHILAVRSDGSVLAWGGTNTYGQLSVPPSATNVIAVAASGGYFNSVIFCPASLALKADGTVVAWGSDQYQELEVPAAATNITAIAASTYGGHCLALRADGAVLGWGFNGSGQASPPASANGAIAIAAGGYFSLALKPSGTVVGWGLNNNGQISIPASATVGVVAIAAGYDHSVALKYDGTVVQWGDGAAGTPPTSATNIVAISAGDAFTVALRADGTILAWGFDNNGDTDVPANAIIPTLTLARRGAVLSGAPASYVLSYSATNTAGGVGVATRTVTVVDTTPPVLTLLGSNPMTLSLGAPFIDPGATASDACAGDLTASIVRTGTVNTAVPGAYTLTYTVTDPSTNSATTNRIVLVTGPPLILGFSAFFSGTNAVTGSPVVQFLAGLNPNGLAAGAFVQFGLTTAYPGNTAEVSLPASFNESTFYGTLDGLIPGGTYHFRIVATNSLGATYGPDSTFTVPLVFRLGDLNGDGRVDAGELAAVVSNYLATSSGLLMTNPVVLKGGLFQFGITNETGWRFSVLSSTNLRDWTLVPTPATPVWQFHDAAATNQLPRFYRIRSP